MLTDDEDLNNLGNEISLDSVIEPTLPSQGNEEEWIECTRIYLNFPSLKPAPKKTLREQSRRKPKKQ